jgi:hypothetical protein
MFDPIERIKNALKKAEVIQPNAAMSCVTAKIVDVLDPLSKGRCKVVLKNFSAANNSIEYSTDWCETVTTKLYKGQLPKMLLGTQVLVFPVNQSYETVVVNLNNKLIYEDNFPEACKENLGVQIIKVQGQETFCSTCLLRNGKYAWVNQCDFKHGHLSGDSQDQDNDSEGDFQMAVEQGIIHDEVFSTETTNYVKESGFTPPILT